MAQSPSHLQAIDVRQPDVEDDALDAGRVLRDLEAGPAIRRDLHDVAIVLEQSLEEPRESGVVLDDEHMHGGQPAGAR